MKTKRLFTLAVTFILIQACLGLGFTVSAESEKTTTTLLKYDFNASSDRPTWTNLAGATITPEYVTSANNTTTYAHVAGGADTWAQLKFSASVPLNAKGGASPGKNAQLIVEYKIAKTAHSNGNGLYAMITNSGITETANGLGAREASAVGSGHRMNNTPPEDLGMWYYMSYIGSSGHDTMGLLYKGTPAMSTADGIDVWVQFKFVITLTDANGSFITPKISVYTTDAAQKWQYPATPSYETEEFISPGFNDGTWNSIDALRISHRGSIARVGIDDINIYLSVDSAAPATTTTGSGTAATTTGSGNATTGSSVSPATGDNTVIFIGIAALPVAGSLILFRKKAIK